MNKENHDLITRLKSLEAENRQLKKMLAKANLPVNSKDKLSNNTVHNISNSAHSYYSYIKKLKQREKDFRVLAQNSPDIILRLNAFGEVCFYNSTLTQQFNFLTKDLIMGSRLDSLGVFDEELLRTWQSRIDYVVCYGCKTSVELSYTNSGIKEYYNWTLSPEKNIFGQVQLMQANQKAKESDRLKSVFLSNISHELRTPLNAIVGFSTLLRKKDLTYAEKEEYVSEIHENSNSLLNLMNNIIDVAKLESGKICINKESVNINSLLKDLYQEYLPKVEQCHKDKVKLKVTCVENLNAIVFSDPIRLKQILVCLLDNAVKFTNKGKIEFGCQLESNRIKLFVRDTGIGVAADKQKMILEPFRKEREGNNQPYGGAGIGLSISNQIVSALGEELFIQSEKGKGAEFYFYLHDKFYVSEENRKSVNSSLAYT
jgi:signal transduction histidine kinase